MEKAVQKCLFPLGEIRQSASGVKAKGHHKKNRASQEPSAAISMESEVRQRGVHASQASQRAIATAQQLMALAESQGFKCAACKRDMKPSIAQVDHKVARADGGGDDISNLQWLCKHCNHAKGTMSMGAFVAMCERIVTAWSPDDQP